MGRIVEIVEYDASWPDAFEQEAQAIRAMLSGLEVECLHIGSTAIPGMPAKPIIDILLSLQDVPTLDNYKQEFDNLGYVALGEYGMPGRRFFYKGGDNIRTHHVHAFSIGSPEIERHILFRDYLRRFPLEAKAYAELKKHLAAAYTNDPDGYTEAKEDFIRHIDAKAWRLRSRG